MFSAGPGAVLPLVLPSPCWIQTLAPRGAPSAFRLTLFSLLAISVAVHPLLSTAITDLRIEPHRLVWSCVYPWGRIKVLATPKPQRQSGEERNFSNAVTRSRGLGGWKDICPLHDLLVLEEVQSICGHTCDYISDNSRCKGKFRAVRWETWPNYVRQAPEKL